ncbi:MAG: MFS transporter [Phenylobacterium sp.]
MATAAGAKSAPKLNIGKIAFTSLAASSIEWYDFFIYGTAAALVFPKLFFASTLPPAVAQIAAFSTFAVGFIARPVGGVVFGHFGDQIGRKRALVTALLIMGLATTSIGLLPSYASIGVAAPILLIVLRFLQGLAVGGQWGGAALLAIENAPKHRRGFFGSFAQLGVPAGLVLGNGIFLLMGSFVAPDAFLEWGWRIPFLLSMALVGLGLYVQLKLEDTADYQALQALEAKKQAEAVKALAAEKAVSLDKARAILRAEKSSPILRVLARHPKEILLAAGSFVAANGTFYVMVTYSVSYATKVLHVPRPTILWAVLLGSLISAPALPLLSALSDRVGRRSVFLTGALLAGLWSFPFFLLLNTGAFPAMLLAILVGSIFNNCMYGPQAALMTELFSTEFRYSGASLGYQIGAIFGGGFAPIIAEALLAKYHVSTPISVYMAVLCTVSFLSIVILGETYKREHRIAEKAAA